MRASLPQLFIAVAAVAASFAAQANKPETFEAVIARLGAEAKTCARDPARDLETIKSADNVIRGPKVRFIAIATTGHPGTDDLGPILVPATPSQLKSLIGKQYCH